MHFLALSTLLGQCGVDHTTFALLRLGVIPGAEITLLCYELQRVNATLTPSALVLLKALEKLLKFLLIHAIDNFLPF